MIRQIQITLTWLIASRFSTRRMEDIHNYANQREQQSYSDVTLKSSYMGILLCNLRLIISKNLSPKEVKS